MSLQGRTAIVTGAAQGIGRAIAEALAQAGADIAVADLDPSRSAETVAAVEKIGRKALNLKVNVADTGETKSMVEQVLKAWGKVDILVNNAGITRDGLLLRMKEEDWNLVLQINLNGTCTATRGSVTAIRSRDSLSLYHQHTAVYVQHMTRDVGGLLGDQETHSCSNVSRRPQATQWNLLE